MLPVPETFPQLSERLHRPKAGIITKPDKYALDLFLGDEVTYSVSYKEQRISFLFTISAYLFSKASAPLLIHKVILPIRS
jgi:hypothetical protein